MLLNNQDANKIIVNYEIIDNKLEIIYLNGNIKEIDYSTEAEKGILEEMENQENKLKEYCQNNVQEWEFIFTAIIGLIIVTITLGAISSSAPIIALLFSIITLPHFLIKAIYHTININNIQSSFKNIKKYELFLENEKEINKDIIKGNCLDNVAQETKEIIMDKENPSLNINDLDKMQLADIESILLNIKRNKLLNLKQENDLAEDNLFAPEALTKDEEYTRTKSLN